MTAVANAKSETEAVLKEDSAEETDTDDGSGEAKEVNLEKDTDGGSDEKKKFDLTAVSKATAETEEVLKEDSAEETDSDDWSGETKEVDLAAIAKATVETEAVLKQVSAE